MAIKWRKTADMKKWRHCHPMYIDKVLFEACFRFIHVTWCDDNVQAYRAFLSVPSCRRTTDELGLAAPCVRSATSCSRWSDRSSCGIDHGSHPPLGICHVSLRAMKPTNEEPTITLHYLLIARTFMQSRSNYPARLEAGLASLCSTAVTFFLFPFSSSFLTIAWSKDVSEPTRPIFPNFQGW